MASSQLSGPVTSPAWSRSLSPETIAEEHAEQQPPEAGLSEESRRPDDSRELGESGESGEPGEPGEPREPRDMAESEALATGPEPPLETSADRPQKRNGRQRFLRSISRISSSPSLAQLGRPRSASAPYLRSGTSLSCVSLASTSSPFGPPSASSTGSSGFAFSPLTSPATNGTSASSSSSFFSPLASPRKVDLAALETNVANATNAAHASLGATTVPLPADVARATWRTPPRKTFSQLWRALPLELKVRVFSCFQPKELVRLSRVSREFHRLCFDGQLWTCFDASDFYQHIPVASMRNIISRTGAFIKNLNLRGCIQVEDVDSGLAISTACSNLTRATLEGSLISFRNLETLLQRNSRLAHLDLTGLNCVDATICTTIAECCPLLETLNLSWCKTVTADMLVPIVDSCRQLRDLRIGEIRGFASQPFALAVFQTNRLERLVVSGCQDLTDNVLSLMIHGLDPELDILTNRPVVPPRRFRYLDLSRCRRLTDQGISALGHCMPDLEGLVLAGCSTLTDAALEPVLASTPRLAYLDLEDVSLITNNLLSGHLARAPCVTAGSLKHLTVSNCENVSDVGMLPLLKAGFSLCTIEMDNTRVSDLTLVEAATSVQERTNEDVRAGLQTRSKSKSVHPRPGLSLAVYDCPNVTWIGVGEVLSRNADMLLRRYTVPPQIVMLKCFYGWQMTVDEHTKRIVRGQYTAAIRLGRKWSDYMQATAEANATGAGGRRRRRRAREAQQVHANEEGAGAGVGADGVPGVGGPGMGVGRRRARTTACAIM